jgi:methylamine---glutamate N-methyltransferase subunit B
VEQVTGRSVEIDCASRSTREINAAIRQAAAAGVETIHLFEPAARHNLCIALFDPVTVVFHGPVGWYCGGMLDGGRIVIEDNCGWAVGENTMSGRIEVHGHAGSSAGATMRGGELFVAGDAGARTGISLKGGAIVVGGSVGYMSGFMMQRGSLVVCGDAADGIGDSMYEGRIYVGGNVGELGADAVTDHLGDDDVAFLSEAIEARDLGRDPRTFTKIVAGRRLWNFSKKEIEVWKAAL